MTNGQQLVRKNHKVLMKTTKEEETTEEEIVTEKITNVITTKMENSNQDKIVKIITKIKKKVKVS